MTIKNKESNLISIIKSSSKIAVAFSGGVDSTYLLDVCRENSEQEVIAISLITPFTPSREKEELLAFIPTKNVSHEIITVDSIETQVLENTPERCYFCKKLLFNKIVDAAKANGCDTIFEGSNFSDTSDYRPGMKAVKELKVKSPLLQAELTKGEIRELSKLRNLKTWDKPANSCLATRVPTNREITISKLKQIDEAEEILLEAGFNKFRVRHHDSIARIEIEPSEMIKFSTNLMQVINKKILDLNFKHVALDLGGYQMGSMNAAK